MSKLRKLFEKRQELYDSYSDRILEILTPTVVSAVVEVLGLSQQEIERLTWQNIRIEQDFLVLVGTINYNEGDVISDGQTTVTLTKQMALFMDKMVRMTLPMQVVESSSKEEVMQYLHRMQQKMQEEYQELYGEEDDDELFGPSFEDQLAAMIEEGYPLNTDDFDYSELTEKQRQALQLSSLTQSHKGKPN